MILSGDEILRNLDGNIIIDPFDERNLNPNSYNLTLHNELITYEEVVLDMRQPNRVRRIVIPEDGLVLGPNQLYLGRAVERTETHNLVPMIQGRSSVGRLGLSVDATAGFGDVGFSGFWTLEMYHDWNDFQAEQQVDGVERVLFVIRSRPLEHIYA